jgi:hypothetical protein
MEIDYKLIFANCNLIFVLKLELRYAIIANNFVFLAKILKTFIHGLH